MVFDLENLCSNLPCVPACLLWPGGSCQALWALQFTLPHRPMSSGAGRASRRVKGEQTNNNTQEPGSNNLPSPTTETNADYRAKPMTPTSSKEKNSNKWSSNCSHNWATNCLIKCCSGKDHLDRLIYLCVIKRTIKAIKQSPDSEESNNLLDSLFINLLQPKKKIWTSND